MTGSDHLGWDVSAFLCGQALAINGMIHFKNQNLQFQLSQINAKFSGSLQQKFGFLGDL